MKIFSDFRAFVLFGVIFLLAIGTVDAQEPFLEAVGSTGFTPNATLGPKLTVVFKTGYDGAGAAGIPLRISTTTSSIEITSPTPVPGTHNTGLRRIGMGITSSASVWRVVYISIH